MAEPTYSGPDAARAMSAPATQTSGSATSGEIAFDVFVKNISQTSNEARLALAQRLKEAGIWKAKYQASLTLSITQL